ncbi:MAG TPA: SMP-30/gluconolactonase/LRE family protein [Bradyrhizobium sp.]|uniref:SMP-30/gluconolactonase/LRE family protein n=1 Tax=Bradyrhizobium sp. TaxID=376 RepID=UPI002B8B8B8D|nr:SMP-30/gluconolactonase/LRE family protein [Bradyrhizobium sp.]HLZ02804.1 SMP-30/gluconolactonase/LRE family protein [Bradyrhizobium sp.]
MFDHLLRDVRSVINRDGVQNAIPPLDGALSPNDRLDACMPIGDPLPGLDDVVAARDGSVYVSAGRTVLKLAGNGLANRSLVVEFEGEAGGLAIHPDGRLLVCVAGRGLAALDPNNPNPRWLESADGASLTGLTSVTAAPDGRIFAVEGSAGREPGAWRHDLMEKRSNGRLIACGAALDHAQVLLTGLPYPYGVAVSADGKQLWLAESWAHRLSRFALTGNGIAQREVIAGNLPGYPARLHLDAHGGFFSGIFARRTHLIEFVLKEDDFREEMLATMAPDYWIAPAFAGGSDCLEPMQIGGVKALGIQKPWAPPRSYGLLVHLDGEGEATDSLHSRAGGRYHGVTGACDTQFGVVIAARGAGRLLLHTGELR